MQAIALRSTPNNPVPEGANVGLITTKDRISIRYAIWEPTGGLKPGEKPKGTVCLFQGRTEFIEKYYDVISELRERGFVVATMDWRGQGLSQRLLKRKPLRGHVRSFSHYRRDLAAFIGQMETSRCPKPYFALAHSMGGHILYSAAERGGLASIFERAVLTAPMLHLASEKLIGLHRLRKDDPVVNRRVISQRPTRWALAALRFLGFGRFYAPGGNNDVIFPFEDNVLTHDEARFQKMNELLAAHKELGVSSPTIAWSHAAFMSMRRVLAVDFTRRIDVPLLIIASGLDRVVSTPAIEVIGSRLRVGHHIVVQGARHEIMFESDEYRSQFWAAFDAYIPGSEPVRKKVETSK